ncbi:hypothetical protein SETIT_1G157000v2 [Setaria italica]|uniref:Uncharacterized protein n=1 Tax=Setaria italica TaxID=4555 RepID=A0A368PKN6_SETIT|nr:hypothetical protein SETIT_1G157000v2 [Setaria italica]
MPLICHGEKKELLEPSGSLEPLPPVAANRSPLVRPAPIAASSNCSPSCGSPAHPGLLCAVLPASLPPYDASPVRRATAGARSAAPHGRMLGAGGTPRASTRGGRTAAASRRSLRITMVQMVFVLASGLNIAGCNRIKRKMIHR